MSPITWISKNHTSSSSSSSRQTLMQDHEMKSRGQKNANEFDFYCTTDLNAITNGKRRSCKSTLYETFSLLSAFLSINCINCVESLTRHYKIVMCHWRQSLAISIRYIWSGWRVYLITYLPFKNWLKAKFAYNLQSEKTFRRLMVEN